MLPPEILASGCNSFSLQLGSRLTRCSGGTRNNCEGKKKKKKKEEIRFREKIIELNLDKSLCLP